MAQKKPTKDSLSKEPLQKLAERARGRVRQLHKKGYKGDDITHAEELLKQRAKEANIRSLFYPRKNIDPVEAFKQKQILISFLTSKTSTIRGVREVEKRSTEALAKTIGRDTLSNSEAKRLGKLFDFLKSSEDLKPAVLESSDIIDVVSNTPFSPSTIESIVNKYARNHRDDYYWDDLQHLLTTPKDEWDDYDKELIE